MTYLAAPLELHTLPPNFPKPIHSTFQIASQEPLFSFPPANPRPTPGQPPANPRPTPGQPLANPGQATSPNPPLRRKKRKKAKKKKKNLSLLVRRRHDLHFDGLGAFHALLHLEVHLKRRRLNRRLNRLNRRGEGRRRRRGRLSELCFGQTHPSRGEGELGERVVVFCFFATSCFARSGAMPRPSFSLSRKDQRNRNRARRSGPHQPVVSRESMRGEWEPRVVTACHDFCPRPLVPTWKCWKKRGSTMAPNQTQSNQAKRQLLWGLQLKNH